VATGTRVSVSGVVVTGVGSSGYMVQDPDDADGQYSAIYVFSSGAPSVSRGDTIDLSGVLGDYFGEAQLTDPTSSTAITPASISPMAITVAQAATEAYEGVLVEITDGTLTNAAYNCNVDGSACADTGLWEIGGSSGILAYDRMYEDADWADHVGDFGVVGVMGYRWNRRRIMPRDAADFGL
jgi:hypothetical protein